MMNYTSSPFVDPDGDMLTLTQTGLPAPLIFTDNGDGTYTITGVAPSGGPWTVLVTGDDGEGGSGTQTLMIDCSNAGPTPPPDITIDCGSANQPPTAPPDETIDCGSQGFDMVDITGPNYVIEDGDEPTLRILTDGTWTSIGSENGSPSGTWKMGQTPSSLYEVKITITSNGGTIDFIPSAYVAGSWHNLSSSLVISMVAFSPATATITVEIREIGNISNTDFQGFTLISAGL